MYQRYVLLFVLCVWMPGSGADNLVRRVISSMHFDWHRGDKSANQTDEQVANDPSPEDKQGAFSQLTQGSTVPMDGLNPILVNCDPLPLFRVCTDKCLTNVEAHRTMDGMALGQWAFSALKDCFNKCRSDTILTPTPGCINSNGNIIPIKGDESSPQIKGKYVPTGLEKAKWWWSWWYYHHKRFVWLLMGLVLILILGLFGGYMVKSDPSEHINDLRDRALETAAFLASIEWRAAGAKAQSQIANWTNPQPNDTLLTEDQANSTDGTEMCVTGKAAKELSQTSTTREPSTNDSVHVEP